MAIKSSKSSRSVFGLHLSSDELSTASFYSEAILAAAKKFGLNKRQIAAGLFRALFDICKVDCRYSFSFSESKDIRVFGFAGFTRYHVLPHDSFLSPSDSDKLPF